MHYCSYLYDILGIIVITVMRQFFFKYLEYYSNSFEEICFFYISPVILEYLKKNVFQQLKRKFKNYEILLFSYWEYPLVSTIGEVNYNIYTNNNVINVSVCILKGNHCKVIISLVRRVEKNNNKSRNICKH